MSLNLSLLGSRVKKFRKRTRFTQEMLAELTNLSVQHIGNIEIGRKGSSVDALIRIADALNVTVDLLLLGNCDSEIITYVCEFAELLFNCNMDERDAILDTAIAVAEMLRSENYR